MSADNRRLGRLRQSQGDIGNHIIDEYAAGRISRRDFIRRGTVVGISLPVLGAVISACGSSGSPSSSPSSSAPAGKSGATIKVGIIQPAAASNTLNIADQGGQDMLGQAGEYPVFSDQPLTLQPQRAPRWSSH